MDPHQKKALTQTLSKSIERGKLIASKIENLKETLAKNDPKKLSTSAQTFINEAATGKGQFLKRNLEQSVTFPLDAKVPARETVIETSDSELVKKKIELLIAGLKPESQQNAFDDSLLFTDLEFSSETAIYSPTDHLQDDFAKSIDFSRIQWKRIKEIAANPLLCGFDQLTNFSQENPHKSLVVQGLLGDNWFLSALSAVFHHDYLWNRITGFGRFDKYRDYGLYVFRFFKDNKQCHVIVDDKLPVLERSTGELIPVFGRCLNPNLFWVSLIEKAYAKLHYRYYALHDGYVEDALYDLTGLNPESLVLDSEHILENKLQKCLDSLKVLTLSGACIVSSISTERVQYSAQKKEKLKMEAESMGLLVNYWYHLNDSRDLNEDEEKPLPLHKLVRIHSPWGLAINKAWNGEFNFKDPKWTERFKERFNAFYLEQRNRYGEDLFAHDFSKNALTGNMVLPLESFVKHYNSMVVIRDFPPHYNGIEYEGCWLPSHGHPNVKSTNWMSNPHYIIKIARKGGELTPITVIIQQKDPRFVYGDYNAKHLAIGMVVLSMSPVEEDVKFYDAKKTIGFVKPTENRFVHWTTNLGNGKYCIIPVTRNAGDVGPYFLKLYYGCTNDEIVLYKSGFKVIMELEKPSENEPAGDSMRVMDASLSAKMVKGFMEKSKMGKWTEKILTPFNLDEILNPPLTQLTSQGISLKPGQSPIKGARSKNRTTGTLLHEYRNDIMLKLYDPKLDKEKEQYLRLLKFREDKMAVLLGLEGDERRVKAPLNEIEIEQNQTAYSEALRKVDDTLDFSYYYLGDKCCLIDVIKIEGWYRCQR
eukprot:TRINITY_DN135154_c2_g1_i1.p1 TRINITY_DN135154_c2_g1~~TRINITY_DN135154_c2_g1_i1.p1  ORF type:complete len:840 (+),score=88.22 TRINITY_DN135154_c2_g1_i1:73-2520(+)